MNTDQTEAPLLDTPANRDYVRTGTAPKSTLYLGGIAAAVVLLTGGFVGGMQYQKGQATTNASQIGQGPGGGMMGGQGGMSQNGSFGSVTAVSATSITVQDQRAGTSKTYSIDSSTAVSKQGATASVSDIATGDQVMVQTASSTSTTATAIRLGGMMGAPGAPSNAQ